MRSAFCTPAFHRTWLSTRWGTGQIGPAIAWAGGLMPIAAPSRHQHLHPRGAGPCTCVVYACMASTSVACTTCAPYKAAHNYVYPEPKLFELSPQLPHGRVSLRVYQSKISRERPYSLNTSEKDLGRRASHSHARSATLPKVVGQQQVAG